MAYDYGMGAPPAGYTWESGGMSGPFLAAIPGYAAKKAAAAKASATTSSPVTAKAAAKKSSVATKKSTPVSPVDEKYSGHKSSSAPVKKVASVSSAAPKTSGTTSMARITSSPSSSVAKTGSSYVDRSPDLAGAWKMIEARQTGADMSGFPMHGTMTPAQQADYWIKRGATSKEAFGQAHAKEDMQLKTGTYKGATKYTPGSDAWKTLFTSTPGQFGATENYGDRVSTAGAPQTRWEMFSPTDPAPSGGGGGSSFAGDTAGGTAPTASSITQNSTQQEIDEVMASVMKQGTVEMNMASLTDEMDLSNKIVEMLDMNSPLFKSARTKALQAMAKRGMVNSSIADEAVMNAILEVAIPIAQAEVNALQTNLYYNTDWTNQQKSAANTYYYEQMQQKLAGALNFKLNKMIQSHQAWGKYGDWIFGLGTMPGMDPGAIDWTMGALPKL